MPRRPDLIQASLLAGLICLGVCLLGPAWSREDTRAQVRLDEAKNGGPIKPFSSIQLASGQLPLKNQPQLKGEATSSSSSQSWMLHWFSGGFLASLLCYYVFGYPLSYVWQEVWPPGLLDFLVLAALCYFGYRFYVRWQKRHGSSQPEARPGFLRLGSAPPPPITVTEEARPGLDAIQELDASFDLQAFGEEVRLLLLNLYEAWNHEDLYYLNGKVKEGLLEYLQMGLKIMVLREESSHLEELTLEGVTVTAAGVNDGRDFITVCFRGRLLDYVLDKSSGKLLLGSMAYPSTFHEYWDLERLRDQGVWVLQDIRDV